MTKSNKIFDYTCCITQKRVTSLRGPFPRTLSRGNTAPFEEMLLRRRVIGITASNLTDPRFKLKTSRFRDDCARPT